MAVEKFRLFHGVIYYDERDLVEALQLISAKAPYDFFSKSFPLRDKEIPPEAESLLRYAERTRISCRLVSPRKTLSLPKAAASLRKLPAWEEKLNTEKNCRVYLFGGGAGAEKVFLFHRVPNRVSLPVGKSELSIQGVFQGERWDPMSHASGLFFQEHCQAFLRDTRHLLRSKQKS